MKNFDEPTIKDFGDEWERFDHLNLDSKEHKEPFEKYFKIFTKEFFNKESVGFDMACGTILEVRFSKKEIHEMIRNVGLCIITFLEGSPYWIPVGARI